MEFFLIVLLGIIFVVAYIFATDMYEIATRKGFPQKKYFWFVFLFGIFGMLLVIALPDNSANVTAKKVEYNLPEL